MEPFHRIELPREIIIGSEVSSKVGDFCQSYGFQGNAIMVTDATTYEIAGKTIANSLEQTGF
ncbi:MAG: NAD(P)-dependent glycerol-1-phosphate dehydrogenase, partial [Candidatus Helarchaeota archaeon]